MRRSDNATRHTISASHHQSYLLSAIPLLGKAFAHKSLELYSAVFWLALINKHTHTRAKTIAGKVRHTLFRINIYLCGYINSFWCGMLSHSRARIAHQAGSGSSAAPHQCEHCCAYATESESAPPLMACDEVRSGGEDIGIASRFRESRRRATRSAQINI